MPFFSFLAKDFNSTFFIYPDQRHIQCAMATQLTHDPVVVGQLAPEHAPGVEHLIKRRACPHLNGITLPAINRINPLLFDSIAQLGKYELSLFSIKRLSTLMLLTKNAIRLEQLSCNLR
ncbi:hypothetical protein [Pseudomonas sp. RA_105y_Pfl2_P56]|uniref:hypothetical protein n=1 Tax=Pseudomonas sp. RA_105y_Pfl2_P56 TaxID=3088701 RepID=UPI0030D7FB8F